MTGYAESSGMTKKEKVDLSGDDCREGLTCVLSVKAPDPKFSSQTKDKLVSSDVQPVVQAAAADAIAHWFETHPKEARAIIGKVMDAAAAREAARKRDPPPGHVILVLWLEVGCMSVASSIRTDAVAGWTARAGV